MSLADDKDWADSLRRGKLNAREEAQLEAWLPDHLEQRGEIEKELMLNHLLAQLPDASLSSNFTAQVLAKTRRPRLAPWRSYVTCWKNMLVDGWVPKVATLVAALSLGLFVFHQQQLAARKELARDLVEISKIASSTPVELLQNFEVIERLNQVPRESERELIAALQ